MRIVVIGGGISGLATAFLARRSGHAVTCLEPSERAGGLMRSERHDGFLCELGPQAVLDDAPDTAELLAALDLHSRLVVAESAARRRFIFARDRLWPVPMAPGALLTSGLLSFRGKLRLLAEPFVRRSAAAAADDRESIAAFGDRRLGREASRVLLGTATIGILAGDARELSLASAFPRLAALEREHGSLFRGMIAKRRAGRKAGRSPGHAISFPEGLGELAEALARSLGHDLVRARAVELRPRPDGSWQVLCDPRQDGVPESFDADRVVIAANAEAAVRLLRPLLASSPKSAAPEAAEALSVLTAARRAPVAIACLGFRDVTADTLGMELAAYGFLVARGEVPRILGCQYESSIFQGRAPAGSVLLRTLLGGIGTGFEPDIVDRPDEGIAARALEDLRRVTGLRREPDMVRVWRHGEGIPQYGPGHAAGRAALDAALRALPGLHVIGFSLRGVGVNECIHAAADVVRDLGAVGQSA